MSTPFQGFASLTDATGAVRYAPIPISGTLEASEVQVEATLDEPIDFEGIADGPPLQILFRLDTGEDQYELRAPIDPGAFGRVSVGTFWRFSTPVR